MIGTFGVAAPVTSAVADNLFYDEGRSVREIADEAASMLLTSWFGSEKDKTDLRMKLIGQGKQFEASIYLPESERSVNSPVIIQASDELKKKAKEILNGRSLSELSPDEKDKLSQLVASNQDQIKTITNPEAGKSKNFWSKATGMTIAGFTYPA